MMIFLRLLSTVVLAVMSSASYRAGGSGRYPRWIRPVGVCTAMTFELMMLGYMHWSLIICFGVMYASLTTYFKKKNTDATWINWMLVGVAFSLSILPIVCVFHLWFGFFARSVAVISLIIFWSETNGNAVCEELGRGFIPVATLPLLMVGA